jgi:hypothetical protein
VLPVGLWPPGGRGPGEGLRMWSGGCDTVAGRTMDRGEEPALHVEWSSRDGLHTSSGYKWLNSPVLNF